MNKADLLTATFRQLAAAKTASRIGPSNATIAKEGKEKAEHFRDQFKLVAQAAKPGSKAETEPGTTDATPAIEVQDRVAEMAQRLTTHPNDRADKPRKKSTEQTAVGTTASPAEWCSPDAALSAVISRLEQAQSLSASDDDATTPVAGSDALVEPREAALKPDDRGERATAGELTEARFALSVDSSETRTTVPIKVAVRDQETHFEPVRQMTPREADMKLADASQAVDSAETRMVPATKLVVRQNEAHSDAVQQTTLLQRIIDRIGGDLPAAPMQAGSPSADVAAPDILKTADKPVRILTLQLDPPDLGAVTVKMRLAGDGVEVRLSADRYETTQMLQHERGALTDIMQSAGYKFDIASIDQSRPSDANAGAGQQQPQPDQRPSQQPGGGQFNYANSERQSGDAQAGTRQNRQQHDQVTEPPERHQDKEIGRDRNGGAVYL